MNDSNAEKIRTEDVKTPGICMDKNPVSILACFAPRQDDDVIVTPSDQTFLFPIKEVPGLYMVKAFSYQGEMRRLWSFSDRIVRRTVLEDGTVLEIKIFQDDHVDWSILKDPIADFLSSDTASEKIFEICTSEDPDMAMRAFMDRLEMGSPLLRKITKETHPNKSKVMKTAFQRVMSGVYDESMVNRYLAEIDRHRGEEWLSVVDRLPFSAPKRETISIRAFREGLEDSHYGMIDVKKKLAEEAAYLSGGLRSDTTICFVGAPGVGKTTIGKSFAKLMKRPFQAITLGGASFDASILTGFQKSWGGAAPGAIINSIMASGADDPIIMLDEIDKISPKIGGGANAATSLLALLDPSQKQTFMDNYLGFHYDISKITFIATANYIDRIAPELVDRLRIIDVPSYSPKEKVRIGLTHILPKMAGNAKLSVEDTGITEDMISEIVANHTREAGCRTLERHIESLIRDLVLSRSEAEDEDVSVAKHDISAVLGAPRLLAAPPAAPGRINGLYASAMGGGTNPIEAVLLSPSTALPEDGSSDPSLGAGKDLPGDQTGNMRHVMKESISVARTAVMSAAASLGIKNARAIRFSHVHALSASTPKEGPSAGVAVSMALISAALRVTPIEGTAVTGEISLMGDVRPVGGIRDKTFGAMAAGLTRIVLPVENRDDFERIPAQDRAGIEAFFVSTLREAVIAVLGEDCLPKAAEDEPVISA